MQRALQKLPGADIPAWLAPLGLSVKLFSLALNPQSLRKINLEEFSSYCSWMGARSFHLVAFAACFVAIALTLECVIELQKYRAQDISGLVISIGLLRELGPLTVSLAWCARIAALVSNEARNYPIDGNLNEFAQSFVFPRYLAALMMSVPLGGYGLVIGFVTAALVAPILGVSSTNDFVESARQGLVDKDIAVYFIKLILVNPTIAVFAGCSAGWYARGNVDVPVGANAVTATFLFGYAANLAVTMIAYLG